MEAEKCLLDRLFTDSFSCRDFAEHCWILFNVEWYNNAYRDITKTYEEAFRGNDRLAMVSLFLCMLDEERGLQKSIYEQDCMSETDRTVFKESFLPFLHYITWVLRTQSFNYDNSTAILTGYIETLMIRWTNRDVAYMNQRRTIPKEYRSKRPNEEKEAEEEEEEEDEEEVDNDFPLEIDGMTYGDIMNE